MDDDLKLTEDLMLNLQRILASFEWDEDDYATVHAFTDGPHYPLLKALVERALQNTLSLPASAKINDYGRIGGVRAHESYRRQNARVAL